MPADQLTGVDLLRGRHPESFHRCPHCQDDLRTVALLQLAYTFKHCDCDLADYVHLAEQLWHRDHLMAPVAGEVSR